MARKIRVESPDAGIQGKPQFDQAAIDAALAGAVTMRDGSPVPSMKKDTPPPPVPPPTAPKSMGVETTDDAENDCKKPADKKAGSTTDSDQKKFGEACYRLSIDAKSCHRQSMKSHDDAIIEYVRGINRRIYDETCNGGFSTNVQFRVTPQDWVNVNHIIDWYRSRGFEVTVKPTTSPMYGKDVGYIDHNFTISWATAAD